ncbi:MAG TPA: pitrilysin family protein [Planctomycetota bacterium]|nr:pitrilysin family protein [Planctomycetota bacterium]
MSAGPAAAPSIALPILRHELACGARLLVSPRAAAPVAALQMHMRGGVSLDPAHKHGTAWLTGGMVDEGTERHSDEQIAELLETAGGALHGDANGIGGSIAATHWERLVDLACESITSPTFPAERVRRQKQRLLDRLLVERDEPRVQGERLFRRLVYGDHWLGRAPTGSIESVARITRADLVRFHRTNWMPQHALFALCADVEPEAARRRFERGLKGWEPGRSTPPPKPVFPARGLRTAVFPSARAQVHLYVGHLGVRRSDPDYSALVVMDHVLGTGPGFTNRISRRLRDELGLAYTVHAAIHHSAGVHPGTFTAYIGTSPQHVTTALEGFLAEIRRIQNEPVGEEELAVAKDYVVGSFALGFQRSARRAGYLISQERHGLPDDHLERYPRALAAVTAADVQRVARAHLFPDAVCVSAAGPVAPADLERALRRAVRRRVRA